MNVSHAKQARSVDMSAGPFRNFQLHRTLHNLYRYPQPRYLLTIIDAYSRWLEAVPLLGISAPTAAQALLANWISHFGPPLTLVTDHGPQSDARIHRTTWNSPHSDVGVQLAVKRHGQEENTSLHDD
jgi:hypothetical protein